MTRGRSPAGRRGTRRSLLFKLLLAGAFIGGGSALIHHQKGVNERLWRELETAEELQREERRQLLARSTFAETLALCGEDWLAELSFYHEPSALAWSHRGLDAYFRQGRDTRSLRQVRCDASGVRLGARIAHPLLEDLAEATAEGGSDSAWSDDEAWDQALHQLSMPDRDPLELGVELIQHPLTGTVLVRRWRGVEGGATAQLDPDGEPSFPLLFADPPFNFAPGEQPPSLRVIPRHRWLREPELAFDLIEQHLPAGARIAELTLTDDRIEISVDSPTPAFDGRPPTPYGDLELDEYGIPEASFWYPREIPGFGCPTGDSLANVRRDFFDAARPPGNLLRAWYSCSPAFSNGRRGTWTLTGDGPSG